jgi:dethiobiotin synthetase
MKKIIVAGCGTGVGKTLVSAILVSALKGAYWKPVQCGEACSEDSDTGLVRNLCGAAKIYPPVYDLKAPVSPHHAARLENTRIETARIIPPVTTLPLIIESVGGVLVPLNQKELTQDLFSSWEAIWFVVSRHYLGSINHTLLTLEILKRRGISVHSLVFNGKPNPDTEEAILHFSKVPNHFRLIPEAEIHKKTIERYADLWQSQLMHIL